MCFPFWKPQQKEVCKPASQTGTASPVACRRRVHVTQGRASSAGHWTGTRGGQWGAGPTLCGDATYAHTYCLSQAIAYQPVSPILKGGMCRWVQGSVGGLTQELVGRSAFCKEGEMSRAMKTKEILFTGTLDQGCCNCRIDVQTDSADPLSEIRRLKCGMPFRVQPFASATRIALGHSCQSPPNPRPHHLVGDCRARHEPR